jgi:hypothetical protein
MGIGCNALVVVDVCGILLTGFMGCRGVLMGREGSARCKVGEMGVSLRNGGLEMVRRFMRITGRAGMALYKSCKSLRVSCLYSRSVIVLIASYWVPHVVMYCHG